MPWGGGGANARKNQRDLERPSAVRHVIELEAMELGAYRKKNSVFVAPSDPVFAQFALGAPESGQRFVYARTFPQYLAQVECNAAVPEGKIALSVVQRKNFEVALLSDVLFSAYPMPLIEAMPPLEGIVIDIRPRFAPRAASNVAVTTDGESESERKGGVGRCPAPVKW